MSFQVSKPEPWSTSVLVNASTGKAATGINGITWRSTFHLPVKSGLKSYEHKKPSDEAFIYSEANTST